MMLTVKPKAIAFDWDGTLADSHRATVETLKYVLEYYKKEDWETTKTKYRDTTKSLKDNFPNFFGAQSSEAYEMYLKLYTDKINEQVAAMSGALEVLEKVFKDDILVCIVSNKEKSSLFIEVEKLFPNIKFYKVMGEGDALHNKPAADPILKAFENCDFAINQENVWMVGDSKQDSDSALNAGVLPIIIGSGKFMEDDYLQKSGITVFKDLKEFQANLGW